MRGILPIILLFSFLYLNGCGNVSSAVQTTPDSNTHHAVNEVMPADIVAALKAKDSGEENSTILALVELPRSLSISIPNIDTTKVHQTHPLQQMQIDSLKSHGFSDEEIANMDFGDYKNIEKTWLLSPGIIPDIKNIYPELANDDISKWTVGDFLAYSMKVDTKAYAPTEEQAIALKARNITLQDARVLLKQFHSYDSILEQEDETLKGLLERHYHFKIDYIKQLAIHSE